jgi:phage host-nuclease inhibitor protein Gam
MKPKLTLITSLCLAAIAAGCNQEKTTSQQINELKAETKEVTQEMKDYTFAQKEEFTATMKSQLGEINRELDQLTAKIENSSASAKAEAQPKLQALREKSALLGKKLDEAQNATESTWDSVKAGTKEAYADLKHGFNQARQWVSEKIAP